jgi:hypothetical protein
MSKTAKRAFVTAEAFLEICKVSLGARKAGNMRILNLAMATNAAFALEMYLKCLLLLENGEAPPRTHDVQDLFHALNESTQSDLTKDHKKFFHDTPTAVEQARVSGTPTKLEELLKLGRHAFVDFRYAHEQIPSDTDWALNGLTYCVRERLLKQQPELKTALDELRD